MVRLMLLLLLTLSSIFPHSSLADTTTAWVYKNNIKNGDISLEPASTAKILTAVCAINTLGLKHRFKTEIYRNNQNIAIRLVGDPFFDGTDMTNMLVGLRDRLNGIEINTLYLDLSMTEEGFNITSEQTTDDPYTAPSGATSINFNTIKYKKLKGSPIAGEDHTPLTELAKELYGSITDYRTSLRTYDNALLYYKEVLLLKAKELGLSIKEIKSSYNAIDYTGDPIYTYINPRSLDALIEGMLKYSNNHIANQLAIYLAYLEFKRSLKVEDIGLYFNKCQEKWLGKVLVTQYDGSGLSDHNQYTVNSLITILNEFKPYKGLLKLSNGLYYKTGTKRDVNSSAGYDVDGNPFAIINNGSIAGINRSIQIKELLN